MSNAWEGAVLEAAKSMKNQSEGRFSFLLAVYKHYKCYGMGEGHSADEIAERVNDIAL